MSTPVSCNFLRTTTGDLCMVSDEVGHMSRAEIFKIHPARLQAKIKCIDFGNEEKRDMTDLLTLPQKYWNIQPFAFRVKVSNGVEVEEATDIEVMVRSRDESGVYLAEVKTDVREAPPPPPPAAQPSPKPASIRSRTESPARPPRPPPIPRNSFSEIRVVYVGPEGCFGLAHSEMTVLGDIQEQINELPLEPLRGLPERGRLYAVQFDGIFSRAEVLEVQPGNRSCRVSFVDFGNEYVTPTEELKHIPPPLCGNIVTFKFRLDPRSDVQPEVNADLEVTPIALEPDGSWLLQLKGEPSKNGLPDDDDAVGF